MKAPPHNCPTKPCLLGTLMVLASSFQFAFAETWYVAPNGDDANNGSIDAPFATLNRVQEIVAPGDTVSIRGGKLVDAGIDIGVPSLGNSPDIGAFEAISLAKPE